MEEFICTGSGIVGEANGCDANVALPEDPVGDNDWVGEEPADGSTVPGPAGPFNGAPPETTEVVEEEGTVGSGCFVGKYAGVGEDAKLEREELLEMPCGKPETSPVQLMLTERRW